MSGFRFLVKGSIAVLALGACLALLAACGDGAKPPAKTPSAGQTPAADGNFRLTSEAFGSDEQIPVIHTCDGHNTSPPLAWDGAPDGTNAFALIMDDSDAPGGTFTHWVLFDLPAETRTLAAGVEASERPPVGGAQGGNDADGVGYTGPCPPAGPAHRYRFTLYALDGLIDLGPGASKEELLDAMEGHVLAQAELAGTYGR